MNKIGSFVFILAGIQTVHSQEKVEIIWVENQ